MVSNKLVCGKKYMVQGHAHSELKFQSILKEIDKNEHLFDIVVDSFICDDE